MREFLLNEFGKEKGQQIYDKQQERLSLLISEIKGKSDSQIKTLKSSILPRIALYEVLEENISDKKTAFKIVEKGFLQALQVVIDNLHKMEGNQDFYKNFCKNFAKDLEGDNWQSTILENDDQVMRFNIEKCLWNDACIENNCPELCEMFCNGDNKCYESMKKMTFKRTQTLGTGGEFCDFKFISNE